MLRRYVHWPVGGARSIRQTDEMRSSIASDVKTVCERQARETALVVAEETALAVAEEMALAVAEEMALVDAVEAKEKVDVLVDHTRGFVVAGSAVLA